MSAADRDTEESSSAASSSSLSPEEEDPEANAMTTDAKRIQVALVGASPDGDDRDSGGAKPWPEDRYDSLIVSDVDTAEAAPIAASSRWRGGGGEGCSSRSFLRRQRHALFYSYMSPILRRGAELHKQRKEAAVVSADSHSKGAKNKNGEISQGVEQQPSKTWRQRLHSSLASSSSTSSDVLASFASSAGTDDNIAAVRELSKDDVYSVPSSMRAQRLADVFWSAQRLQQQKQQRQGSTTTTSSSNSPTVAPFLNILWTLSRPSYLPAGAWQLVVVLCQCSLPLLVREVLLRLEQRPGEPFRAEGLPLALATFALSLLEGVGGERHKFLAFRTGITLRAAVVSAAHGHVLRMTPGGRAGLSSGEINNLVAVDAQKLFELAQEGHYSWSCPLAMVIVSVLLLSELGPSALVGIAAMFLIVPFVQWVVRRMMTVRKKRAAAADKRVESTSAMLQGIRFAKLNRYEEKFVDRILSMRKLEVKLLRKELFYLALTIFATVVSPVIASGLTFVTYALMDESHVLTPSMTFTSLFLFAALRFPINYAGKFMGKAAQGFQACHRFSVFFARDSLDDWRESHGDVGGIGGDSSHVVAETGNESAAMLENGEVGVEGSVKRLQIAPIEEPGDDLLSPIFDNGINSSTSSAPLIDVKASFSIGTPGGTSSSSFTLSEIEMTVHRSQIMCVVGPVASGKSTLVQGLIGELLPSFSSSGSSSSSAVRHQVVGKVAYAAQVPFILNATVRDNILFGEPYDPDLYQRVLRACCLESDIEGFHYGDLTEIGERGVTLSGGQKQRLSLARVAYSRPDVAILDDPLSALDAGTGGKVFERLFQPKGSDADTDRGLFADSAVVLVTHASHFLNRVDSMMVLVNGKSVFVGSWDELGECRPSDPNEVDAIEAIRSSVQEDHVEEEEEEDGVKLEGSADATSTPMVPSNPSVSADDINRSVTATNGPNPNGNGNDPVDGKIMSVEERKYGLSQFSTWLSWFRHAGGPLFFGVILIAMTYDRFMYVATEWWLAIWTQGAYESTYKFGRLYEAQIEGLGAQMKYVETYLYILLISCVMSIVRINWIIQGGARCASKLFVLMLQRVLYAPMSYFDTTPVGRIMNRFTYDTETLDVTLVMNMTMLMTSLGWIFTGIILQSIILPWQLFAILLIVVVYWMLVLHYRKSAVDLQRLDATSRSPVQAQLAEAIDGTSTMRVFGKTSYFSSVFRASLDENSGMMMNFMAAHRWLAVRIQMLGACSVLFSIAFVACFNDVLLLDPGIAAMLIIWSANFNISLSFFVQGISESEASMTSLERVLAMTEIPQEEDRSRALETVDPSWPKGGHLTFENVNLRYRPGLPLSLDGLSFTLKSGQRCGVVGRTGAGKSTLAAALFRLVELEGGRILLDGVDVSKISLADVRGRPNGMTIIPQEPVLLPGTLRRCLDPFGDYTDEEVAEALLSVRGASRGLGDVNSIVEEGGRNFSVGGRQLICLGRAMLARPRLLFLDEATASVDGETDAHIQRMLRSRFEGTTLLTIAHRLNTIMDYDVILVVDKGRAAEFGTPAELLSREDSIFSQLVESTGKESSVALRSMVLNNP